MADAACSSADEVIDFDNELDSDFELDGSLDEEKVLNHIHPRRQLVEEPKRFSAVAAMMEDDNMSRFKVVGYTDVALTCKPTTVTASWVSASTQFSAQIASREVLSKVNTVLGISPKLIGALSKFTDVLFPVQTAVFPAFFAARQSVFPPRDFVITAPTGSGKTLCFVIPILNALEYVNKDTSVVFALVIAPVQNLAQQIYMEFIKYNVVNAKIVLLNGLQDYDTERNALFPMENLNGFSHVHIIVATPARLVEHLVDSRGVIDLSRLRFLVVDEADRLNDTARMEWLDIVERRAHAPPTNSLTITEITRSDVNLYLQKVLCSATLSLDLDQLHIWNLRCPRLFKAQDLNNGTDDNIERKADEDDENEKVDEREDAQNFTQHLILPSNLQQEVVLCQTSMKPAFLYLTLATEKSWKKILVFVNLKADARKLTRLLSTLARSNFKVVEFSSEKYANRRVQCLKQFEEGKIRVLISTDVLSRGIDVTDIDCVINYHPPINERIYVHRAGRTARGLATGTVISIVDKEEKMRIKRMLMSMGAWKADILKDKRKTEDFINESLMRKYKKTLEYLQSKKEQAQ